MIIFIMLIAHLLADFTFQTTKLVQQKQENKKYILSHALIYAGTISIAILPFVKFGYAILPLIIIIVSHFAIDYAKTFVDKKFSEKSIVFASFIVDQILHVLVLAVVYYGFNLNAKKTVLYNALIQNEYFSKMVIYLLILALLWDASAVFIKKLFLFITYEDGSVQEENDPQIGRIIGKLERIIISVLVVCNQFTAIGFVITAKSIARFKQLEDKNFAEKYLVGTLASAGIAFIVTVFLKKFLQ